MEDRVVLSLVLGEIVRVPPHMEDPAMPCRVPHSRSETGEPQRFESLASGIVGTKEGAGGHVAESRRLQDVIPPRRGRRRDADIGVGQSRHAVHDALVASLARSMAPRPLGPSDAAEPEVEDRLCVGGVPLVAGKDQAGQLQVARRSAIACADARSARNVASFCPDSRQ